MASRKMKPDQAAEPTLPPLSDLAIQGLALGGWFVACELLNVLLANGTLSRKDGHDIIERALVDAELLEMVYPTAALKRTRSSLGAALDAWAHPRLHALKNPRS